MRIATGPLPKSICRIGTAIRVFAGSSYNVLSLIITGTKFMFVCIFRSIPTMDDNFLSLTISLNVYVLIFLSTLTKFYLDDRPNVTEVRINVSQLC